MAAQNDYKNVVQLLDTWDKKLKELAEKQAEFHQKTVKPRGEKMSASRKKPQCDSLAMEMRGVAPCLIIKGLKMETNKLLEAKVTELFKALKVTPEQANFTQVERFGTGRKSSNPLVRVKLTDPTQKAAIFGNVTNLRGNKEFANVSIQDEVPKSLLKDYREAASRAKSCRADFH